MVQLFIVDVELCCIVQLKATVGNVQETSISKILNVANIPSPPFGCLLKPRLLKSWEHSVHYWKFFSVSDFGLQEKLLEGIGTWEVGGAQFCYPYMTHSLILAASASPTGLPQASRVISYWWNRQIRLDNILILCVCHCQAWIMTTAVQPWPGKHVGSGNRKHVWPVVCG